METKGLDQQAVGRKQQAVNGLALDLCLLLNALCLLASNGVANETQRHFY